MTTTQLPTEVKEAYDALVAAAKKRDEEDAAEGEDNYGLPYAEDCYATEEKNEWHVGCEFGLPYTLVYRDGAWYLRSHHSGEDKAINSAVANAQSWFG